MRKLKGIMINGEWLGEKVVVNNFFRTLCNISPIIMLEFVKLINKLEYKNEVFTITGFEFPSTDTIHISFENATYFGIVDLVFVLENNNLKLESSILDITPMNEKIVDSSAPFEFYKQIMPEQGIKNLDNSILEDKNEVELNSEDIFVDEVAEENLAENIQANTVEQSQIQEKSEDNVQAVESNFTETFEENVSSSLEEILETSNIAVSTEIPQEEVNIEAVKNDVQNSCLEEVNIDSEVKSEDIDVKIENTECETAVENLNNEEKTEEVVDETAFQSKVISEEVVALEAEDNTVATIENSDDEFEIFESLSKKEGKSEVTENEADLDFDENCAKKRNIDIDFDFDESENENTSKASVAEIKIASADLSSLKTEVVQREGILSENSRQNCIAECDGILDQDNEQRFVDKENFETEDIQYLEDNIETYSCLADFYTVEESIEENLTKDNVVVKTSLTQVEKRAKLADFFSEKEEATIITDEEADFRILGDGARINAAILDEDSFFAGEKIYRWGDTLYLDR